MPVTEEARTFMLRCALGACVVHDVFALWRFAEVAPTVLAYTVSPELGEVVPEFLLHHRFDCHA